MNKNRSNDLKIDYKSPFNLMELTGKDLDFEKFEEFEGFLNEMNLWTYHFHFFLLFFIIL
jgi:hypothetical protein